MRKLCTILAALAIAGVLMGQSEGCTEETGGGGGQDTGLDEQSKSDKKKAAPKTFKTRRFKGNGSSNIGNLKLPADAILSWTHSESGDLAFFSINDDDFGISVQSDAAKGKTFVEKGTYKNVEVGASGSWTITIRPR